MYSSSKFVLKFCEYFTENGLYFVKIFVIHSGKDENYIKNIIKNELENKLINPEILLLSNVQLFWKHDADIKIKQSDLVLFFVGETSSQSKNIA